MLCIAILAISIFAGLIFIRLSFYEVTVQGLSMLPTLDNLDRVLIWRNYPRWFLRPNLLIVFQLEPSRLLIKRLIGLPDSIVKLPEQTGRVYDSSSHSVLENGIIYRVWHIPPHCVFVKSDGSGRDSLSFGPVPIGDIIGVVVWRLPRDDQFHTPDFMTLVSDGVSDNQAERNSLEQ